MSHPLLTKVLETALNVSGVAIGAEAGDDEIAAVAAATIPPHIADRLEAALDVCGYEGFGFPCPMTRSAHGPSDHPYQPLVTP